MCVKTNNFYWMANAYQRVLGAMKAMALDASFAYACQQRKPCPLVLQQSCVCKTPYAMVIAASVSLIVTHATGILEYLEDALCVRIASFSLATPVLTHVLQVQSHKAPHQWVASVRLFEVAVA